MRLTYGAHRDALAKTLYTRLFTWLLKQISVRLSPPREADGAAAIAVVDAFGFEVTLERGRGEAGPCRSTSSLCCCLPV